MPLSSDESGRAREQIGEIVATMHSLDNRLGERMAEAREERQETQKAHEAIWREFRSIKHDLRQSDQAAALATTKSERRMNTMEKDVALLQQSMQSLAETGQRLVVLGQQFEAVRNKAAGMALVAGGILSVIIALIVFFFRPLWDAALHHFSTWLRVS